MKYFGGFTLRPALSAALALLLASLAQAQNAVAPGPSPLPGVSALYAHQGDNSIIAYATPDGYARVQALVRHLDGDLDIIRTDVSLVMVSPDALKQLGGSSTASSAALLAAFHAGHLAATAHLRLTTREDTPIDVLLGNARYNSIPLSFVPREGEDGTLSVELLQPAVVSQTVTSDGTLVARLPDLVARLPDTPNGTLRVLFLTPRLIPSAAR